MVLHLNAAFSIELEIFGANPAIHDCTGLAGSTCAKKQARSEPDALSDFGLMSSWGPSSSVRPMPLSKARDHHWSVRCG